MDIVILGSARRHGVPDDDVRHAVRNPIWAGPGDDMLIIVGPAQDAHLLEVGYHESDDGTVIVFHAMNARDKFVRRIGR